MISGVLPIGGQVPVRTSKLYHLSLCEIAVAVHTVVEELPMLDQNMRVSLCVEDFTVQAFAPGFPLQLSQYPFSLAMSCSINRVSILILESHCRRALAMTYFAIKRTHLSGNWHHY